MTDLDKKVLNNLYDKICPICKKEFVNKRITTFHMNKVHSDEMAKIKEYKNIIKKLSQKDTIECPLCKKNFKELARHLKKKHYISTQEFRLKYPLIPLKVVSALSKKDHCKCHLCGKEYKAKNALGLHYKNKHPEYFKEMKQNEKKDMYYKCPICGKETNVIRQHVIDGHDLFWEDFCKRYNWDIKNSKYISDEYRQTLSKNKKAFYASKKGLERRKIQSEDMKGDKNFACRPEVRSKLSKSAIKRMKDHPFFTKSYGIKFKFIFNKKKYFCRSFEELTVIYYLLRNNIKFKYEKTRIRYIIDGVLRTYVLDFEINGVYYELKSSLKLSEYNIQKYSFVNKSLSSIGKKLEIVTRKELSEKFNFKVNLDEVYAFCREKINNNEMNITNYSYCKNSRILNKITKNYKENPNIKFVVKEIKNEI